MAINPICNVNSTEIFYPVYLVRKPLNCGLVNLFNGMFAANIALHKSRLKSDYFKVVVEI